MWVIGHRGSAGTRPENTLAAVRAALDDGADWIEIDVHAAAGALLVIHDATVDRTTDGHGPLGEHTLAELRALDAGDGERIPLLEEVLDLVDGQAGVNVEIKDPAALVPVLALVQARLAVAPRWRDRLLLSSFMPEVTAALAARRGAGWRLGALYRDDVLDPLDFAATVGAWSLHPPLRALDAILVERAHAADRAVLVYTVNAAADIRRCLALGVDGIYTDYPARAVAIRAAAGAAAQVLP